MKPWGFVPKQNCSDCLRDGFCLLPRDFGYCDSFRLATASGWEMFLRDEGRRINKEAGMTTRDKIEVMEAYERGEQIQFVAGNVGIWNDFSRDYLHEPTWDWQHLTYRIKPKEPVKPKLNRWPIVEKNGNLYVENLEMLPLDRMCSRREFRTGHFELNDGTKSKIPYLWKDKKTGAPHSCLAESNNADYYESLYPVAVWLEE